MHNFFINHLTLWNSYNFFIIEYSSLKLSHISLCTWEICLFPVSKLYWVTRWRYIQWIRKYLVSKYFTLLMVHVLCSHFNHRSENMLNQRIMWHSNHMNCPSLALSNKQLQFWVRVIGEFSDCMFDNVICRNKLWHLNPWLVHPVALLSVRK
jgi:hypothetical protein